MGLRRRRVAVTVMGGGTGGYTDLFRDEFYTSEAAPIADPRTLEPGPGTADLIDTGNKASIASGAFQWSSATGNYDPAIIYLTPILNAVGTVVVFELYSATPKLQFGFLSVPNNPGPNRRGALYQTGTALNLAMTTGEKTAVNAIATIATGTTYLFAFIVRTSGLRYAIKGGTFTDWTLLFDESEAAATRYAFVGSLASPSASEVERVVCAQLSSPTWTDDNLLYSVQQTNPVSGAAFEASQAESLYKLSVTAPAVLAGSAELRYDVIDADNYSVAYFNDAGAFLVDSVVAGTPTNTLTVAEVMVGGQAGGIYVIPRGTIHRFWTYASATGWTQRGNGVTMPAVTDTSCEVVFSGYSATKFEVAPSTISLPFDLSSTGSRDFFAVGDSKTQGVGDDTPPALGENGFPPILLASLQASGQRWHEIARIGLSGYSVAALKDEIDARLSAIISAPDYILLNLGRNNVDYKTNATLWVSNYQYIIDAMHAKWPLAKVYLMRVGAQSEPTVWVSMGDVHIPLVIAGRVWAHLGPDERVFLEGGDDYATYTTDGSHPNRAGYTLTAVEWKTVIGF